MANHLIDLTGKRFGRLIVVRQCDGLDDTKWWLCVCDCGESVEARGHHLKAGQRKSCGCYRRDYMRKKQTTHGEAASGRESAEYRAWRGMLRRCYTPDAAHKRVYQDRGIIVCDQWRTSFQAFLVEVGRRPTPNHSLDRWPDNNGNYESGNVRWATRSEQAKNRRHRQRADDGTFTSGAL